MNRADYYNYIEEKLVVLGRRIELRGKLNVLDYHIHSEYFYRDFFNLLYGSILEDKLPESLKAEENFVVKLSQQDKLFRIENPS